MIILPQSPFRRHIFDQAILINGFGISDRMMFKRISNGDQNTQQMTPTHQSGITLKPGTVLEGKRSQKHYSTTTSPAY